MPTAGSKVCSLESNNVIVFPLSKARNNGVVVPTDPDRIHYIDINKTRLLTEKTVSNIIYQLIETDGFVISSYPIGDSDTELEVEFNLMGYYFKINLNFDPTREPPSPYINWTNIYANIVISNEYNEIIGQDSNGKYEGLVLSDSPNLGVENTHTLKILTKVSGNWEVPASSMTKFYPSSFSISRIDGKH